MKTALLESSGHIVLTQTAMPEINTPNEVLIQVKSVGICGSEVHAYEGKHPFRKAPVIMGHEMAGVIAAVGEDVTDLAIGERVVVDPQKTCGTCLYCRTGDLNLCPSKIVLGTETWPGGFGEYVIVSRHNVFHLPEQLSFAQGAVIEPLSVAVHIGHRANLTENKSVAILGAGSIGGLTTGVAKVFGAHPIIVMDNRQHCLDVARERLGASHSYLLPDKDIVRKIKKLTNQQGLDVVIISADEASLLNLGLELLKPRGVIVLVALLVEAPLQFMAYEMIKKETQIIGDYMSNMADVQQAIDLAASGQIDVSAIITHQLPIDQAQLGMELTSKKEDDVIKVILSF